MSSFRSFAEPKTLPTNVTTPNILYYYDNGNIDDYMPVPFTVTDGILDINIQNNVTADLLTAATFTGDFDNQDGQATIMGGLSPVSSLGPNMLTFLKNFIADYEDNATEYALVTNLEIYNAPTMTKIRYIRNISGDDTYQFSSVAPVKTTPNPIEGGPLNNYNVVWIFKTPLVVSYKYDGSATKYLTFVSAMDSP
jgi:hypothetical protein